MSFSQPSGRPHPLAVAALLAGLVGCVPPPPPAPGMTQGDAGPPAPDFGPGGDACERTPLAVAPQTPQIVLLLDRSGSMGAARWPAATLAVTELTASLDPSWEVGFGLFPNVESDDDCGMGGLEILPAPNTAPAIATLLSDAHPHGSTPTTEALAFAGDALATLRAADAAMSMPRPQAVVLVTDGASNCDPIGNIIDSIALTNDAVSALSTDGVLTYVIGYDIGSGGLAARALDDWAASGGTVAPRHVRDGETLSAELHAVVANSAPCAFGIASMPEDPTLLRIRLDGRVLRRDVDYDFVPGEGIVLRDAVCAEVRDGETHPLTAELLCVGDFG